MLRGPTSYRSIVGWLTGSTHDMRCCHFHRVVPEPSKAAPSSILIVAQLSGYRYKQLGPVARGAPALCNTLVKYPCSMPRWRFSVPVRLSCNTSSRPPAPSKVPAHQLFQRGVNLHAVAWTPMSDPPRPHPLPLSPGHILPGSGQLGTFEMPPECDI